MTPDFFPIYLKMTHFQMEKLKALPSRKRKKDEHSSVITVVSRQITSWPSAWAAEIIKLQPHLAFLNELLKEKEKRRTKQWCSISGVIKTRGSGPTASESNTAVAADCN